MQKKLSLGLTLGFIGNLLFVIFAFVCIVFYELYDPESTLTEVLKVLAYTCEFTGFAALAASDLLISTSVRMRKIFKFAFTFYIILEAVMMYLELNSFKYIDFYAPYSMWLAIVHSLVSAVVCFTFVSLDPYKSQFETTIIICIGVILGGMFGTILGIRVYFSILVNAIAYTGLFAMISSLRKRNLIEIDCYGDSARVAEYKGFFSDEEPSGKPAKTQNPEKASEQTEKPGEEEPGEKKAPQKGQQQSQKSKKAQNQKKK